MPISRIKGLKTGFKKNDGTPFLKKKGIFWKKPVSHNCLTVKGFKRKHGETNYYIIFQNEFHRNKWCEYLTEMIYEMRKRDTKY